MAIYKRTINVLNSEYIRATIGVKQGGPMSCILFIIYLNVMVLMIKLVRNDSFLEDLHLMVLMDDTVLLGTTRAMIIEKFSILMDFCEKYGMAVNEIKTNILVINGTKKDREDFVCKTVTVRHAESYIYLGSPFTEDGNIRNVIGMHLKTRNPDLNKFKIFCQVNATMPYVYKKMVLEAVIMCSLLYGCESWLTEQFKKLEKFYIGALKALLGVRETTRTDVVLIESGMPTSREFIRKKTASFVKKNVRGDIDETPLAKVYKMCERSRTPGYVHIKRILDYPEEKNLHDLKLRFTNEAGSKATTYREINASLSVHPVYRSNRYIDERKRVVFTKFRTSSHSLKVETGRWSRVLRENRLCGCGVGVQDEHHVVFD